jgi:hypothetical protein
MLASSTTGQAMLRGTQMYWQYKALEVQQTGKGQPHLIASKLSKPI